MCCGCVSSRTRFRTTDTKHHDDDDGPMCFIDLFCLPRTGGGYDECLKGKGRREGAPPREEGVVIVVVVQRLFALSQVAVVPNRGAQPRCMSNRGAVTAG